MNTKLNRLSGSRALLIGLGAFLALLGALITYKAGGAMSAIAKVEAGGTISPKSLWYQGEGLDSMIHAVNYMGWVAIALTYGILIGASVRAFLPRTWLDRTLGAGGIRGQVTASLAGVPLMLCSCCATPVFEGAYRRTGKLGPSLALLIAPPALNPGALVLTFLLFPPSMGWLRLVASLGLVLLGMAWVGRTPTSSVVAQDSALETLEHPSLFRAFGQSLKEVATRSLPGILIGIFLSAWLITDAPVPDMAASLSGFPLLLVATFVAVLIALPTFAEIPIALALLHAGAPHGVALAVLIAGPAINLPSLFGVAALSSWRVAVATAGAVFAVSVGAGLLA